MYSIKSFFNYVGNIEFSSNNKYVSYRVYKTDDIIKVIISQFYLILYNLVSLNILPYGINLRNF